MIHLFRDLMKDAIRQRGCLGSIGVWWRVAAELPATAWEQHLLDRESRIAIVGAI
ncbi:hypothetical protein [Microcoleus sp. herbarium12]|uniref:hypothetical protein n=1 Tax=Microcoleus sp. herbarium12 TaxID=3055437 RepID=UPI002FD2CAE7